MRNPIALLKASWDIFVSNPKLYVGIMLLPAVVSYLLTLSGPSSINVASLYEWAIYGAFMLILFVVNLFMAIALILALQNPELTVKSAYSQASRYFWRYFVLSILLTVILGVAYILFIIPGIWLTVWFAFAVFVLILENNGIIASLKKSRQYVKGRWWGVFARLLCLILLSLVLSAALATIVSLSAAVAPEYVLTLIILAGNLIIVPITMGYLYALYQDVRGSDTAVSPTPTSAPSAPATPTSESISISPQASVPKVE